MLIIKLRFLCTTLNIPPFPYRSTLPLYRCFMNPCIPPTCPVSHGRRTCKEVTATQCLAASWATNFPLSRSKLVYKNDWSLQPVTPWSCEMQTSAIRMWYNLLLGEFQTSRPGWPDLQSDGISVAWWEVEE